MTRALARLAAPALLATAALAQGENAFLRGTGHLDVATSYSLDTYGGYRLGDPPGPRIDDVERRTFDVYAAYGLREDLDLVVNGAYVSAESEAGSGFPDESDLQDAAVRLKWRLGQRALGAGTFTWLFAPGYRFPLANYTTFADNALSGVGEGDTVVMGRVVGQYTWRSSYVALETGYDHRSGKLDDEVPVHLSLGTTIERTTLQLFFTNILALGDTVSNPLISDERDGYIRVGLGAYVRITDAFGLSLSVRYSDEGENEATGASIGTVFRL